jgi:hypothetical protein
MPVSELRACYAEGNSVRTADVQPGVISTTANGAENVPTAGQLGAIYAPLASCNLAEDHGVGAAGMQDAAARV